MDNFYWLQDWYQKHCNGDWEHGYGIKIDTIDNPGWSVEIYLIDTELERRNFENSTIERTDEDWIQCKVEDGFFKGYGGAKNLIEILAIFRKWATEAQ